MYIAPPVAGLPSSHSGTSECRDCRIVRDSRKFARRWKNILRRVNVAAVSRKAQARAVHGVTSYCQVTTPHPTLRPMRREQRKAGAGNEIGADSIASSSKTNESTITSDDGLWIQPTSAWSPVRVRSEEAVDKADLVGDKQAKSDADEAGCKAEVASDIREAFLAISKS